MLVAVGVVGVAAATSSAACSGTACKDNVGLASAYTRHTAEPSGSVAHCPGNPIDPVNVFWFGTGAFNTSRVSAALASHGWSSNDESSIFLRAAQLAGLADIRQAVTDNSFGCITDTGQRATDNFASQDRLHVRLMVTANPTKPGTVHYVVGDAHHDKGLPGGTCKRYNVPFIQRTLYAHSSVSFNDSRNAIATIWRKMGHTPHFDNWINTKPLKQCNGMFTQSDGMVAAMPQPGS